MAQIQVAAASLKPLQVEGIGVTETFLALETEVRCIVNRMRVGVVGRYRESVTVAALKGRLQAVVARSAFTEVFTNTTETRQGRGRWPHCETQIAAIRRRDTRSARNRVRYSKACGVRGSVRRVERIRYVNVVDYLRQMASELAHVANCDDVGAKLPL